MDTGLDFIKPEFLNLLFFQQKNLVIFPYMDIKHLHSLEVFTAGYNIIDLESTALYNLKEIIEFESNNSYSQTPSLYLIFNLDAKKVKEITKIKDIRCVLNANENVSNLANGNDFIFYNKKIDEFINYNPDNVDLSFEKQLISSSANIGILHDEIQKIKAISTKIFTEINQDNDLSRLSDILVDYDHKFWNKILDHVRCYYKVNIPEVKEIAPFKKTKAIRKKSLPDFSNEYELIVTLNKGIGKDFIQLLHDYRKQKVNSSNLDLKELYNPQLLYNYLRNHHWKANISEDFLDAWVQKKKSSGTLSEDTISDFEEIFKKINVSSDISLKLLQSSPSEQIIHLKKENISVKPATKNSKIPDIVDIDNWPLFKAQLLKKIRDIEKLIK